MITVHVVDDHAGMREIIRLILGCAKDIEVVGYSQSASGIVQSLKLANPDVVLMDIRIPGGDGISVTKAIKDAGLNTKVLMVSALDDNDQVLDALSAGASGYLTKSNMAKHLLQAINEIHNGSTDFFLDKSIGTRWQPHMMSALRDGHTG